MDSPEDLRAELAQFTTPTAHLWVNATWPWLKYSDGVQAFAEHAGSGGYWVLDAIGRRAHDAAKLNHRLHITLTVLNGTAWLTATDGATQAPQIKPLRVPRVDCPEGDWHFILEDGGDYILMLPTEL